MEFQLFLKVREKLVEWQCILIFGEALKVGSLFLVNTTEYHSGKVSIKQTEVRYKL